MGRDVRAGREGAPMTTWHYLAKGKLLSSGGAMDVRDDTGAVVGEVALTSGRVGRPTWRWQGPTAAWTLVAPRMFRRTYQLTPDGSPATAIRVTGMVRPRFVATTSAGRTFEVRSTAGVDRVVEVAFDGAVVATMQRRTSGTQQWLTSREHWAVQRRLTTDLARDERALLEAAPVLVDHRRRQREGQD